MQNKKIRTLKNLYGKLDELYKKIYKFCRICKEEDCKGYTWLLPEEAKKLVNKNIPLIEVNKRLNFINSFSKKSSIINLEKIWSHCIFRQQNSRCSIYTLRPLICRLYPLDFKILNKQIYIVLHIDCLFIKELIKTREIGQFIEKVLFILYNCDKRLLDKILNEYKLVDYISKYPKNYKGDNYIKILKVVNLKQNKIKICQNANRSLTLKR